MIPIQYSSTIVQHCLFYTVVFNCMYFDRTKKQNGCIFRPLLMKESAKKRLKELPWEDILTTTSTFNRLLEQKYFH